MQRPDEHVKTIATITVPCAGSIVSFGWHPAAWVLIRTEDGDAVLVGADPFNARVTFEGTGRSERRS